jgi:hypothetical protein
MNEEGKMQKFVWKSWSKSTKTMATKMHIRLKIKTFLAAFAPFCGCKNS